MIETPYALADVPDGWVGWIRGRIVGPAPLVAPISGRACVYYQVLAKDAGDSAALGHERRGVPFMIDDGTGRATVDPGPAFVELDYDHEVWADPWPQVLARLRVARADYLREGVLAIGETVVVHGRHLRDAETDQRRVTGYRELPPTHLRVSGNARIQLFISEVAV